MPSIQSALSEIDQNTKATAQVTQLKNLNEQVLKQVKPLQPVLQDLNTDSAKLARITDSILSTTKGAEQQAKKNQGLVAKLAAGAAESDRIIAATNTSATGVQKAIEGMVPPGRSTLRNVLETQPSIGSVNLQVNAIVKDLDSVVGFVVKAIEKAAVGRVDKACANPKNKVKCAVGRKIICSRDKSLPFCKKGSQLGDRAGRALSEGEPQ